MECRVFDRSVWFVEGIDGYFDEVLVHFTEEVFNLLFAAVLVVEEHESDAGGGDETGHLVLIESIHCLEKHFVRARGPDLKQANVNNSYFIHKHVSYQIISFTTQ